MMYRISESELTFLRDLYREAMETNEVPDEFSEGITLIDGILETEQIELKEVA